MSDTMRPTYSPLADIQIAPPTSAASPLPVWPRGRRKTTSDTNLTSVMEGRQVLYCDNHKESAWPTSDRRRFHCRMLKCRSLSWPSVWLFCPVYIFHSSSPMSNLTATEASNTFWIDFKKEKQGKCYIKIDQGMMINLSFCFVSHWTNHRSLPTSRKVAIAWSL